MARTTTPAASRRRGEHDAPAKRAPRRATAADSARVERRAQAEAASDSLQIFLNQASRHALLTAAEEVDI